MKSSKNGINKRFFWEERSGGEHGTHGGGTKSEKSLKKVLTFGCQNDIIIKLTRERAGRRKAKDLEN